MTQPRLLVVSTVEGAIRAFLLPLADHFRAKGWHVEAMAAGAPNTPEIVEAFDEVHDATWARNPLARRNLTMGRRLRHLVESRQIDLVHVHTPVAGFVSRMALRSSGVPVVYTAHGFHFYPGAPPLRNTVVRSLERVAGRWTSQLVVMNRVDWESAVRYGLVPEERLHFIRGVGVDFSVYQPGGDQKLDPSVVLMVAEFQPRKRHDDALAAFATLRDRNAQLWFAGDGPTREATEELARNLGIAERVRFLGKRRDVPELLRRSTLLLLPSEQEGLPRAVMEAMATEVPVVGTEIRGMTDLLEDGGGILVPLGDVDAMARALDELLASAERRRLEGERGRASVDKYALEHVLEHHERIYKAALS